jgi:hypothetical protein
VEPGPRLKLPKSAEHCPEEQALPLFGKGSTGHACPHVPQLALSVCVSVQLDPSQFCWPGGHPQTPPFTTLEQAPTVQAAHEAPPFPQDEADWFPNASHVVVLLLQQPLQPLPVLHTHCAPAHVVPVVHVLLGTSMLQPLLSFEHVISVVLFAHVGPIVPVQIASGLHVQLAAPDGPVQLWFVGHPPGVP